MSVFKNKIQLRAFKGSQPHFCILLPTDRNNAAQPLWEHTFQVENVERIMEKSAQLLSHSSGETGGTRGGFYALWRGSEKQRGPKSEPHDHFSLQQLLLHRPGRNQGHPPPAPKKPQRDWNGNRGCSPHLHLNISNLKKVISPHLHSNTSDLKNIIFLDERKSVLSNNKTWWEMTGGSDMEGKYRRRRSKPHASLHPALAGPQISPFLRCLFT